jgi:hypothetical protein
MQIQWLKTRDIHVEREADLLLPDVDQVVINANIDLDALDDDEAKNILAEYQSAVKEKMNEYRNQVFLILVAAIERAREAEDALGKMAPWSRVRG